ITNNGKKCLILSVEMKSGQDISKMGKAVNAKLDNVKLYIRQEVKLYKITDQSKVVDDSIYSFLEELLIAIVSVILVVILLMPIRVALVSASTIPITIFISLGMFYIMNIELNTVTLAALIVTLGMIVDDSIVIIDSYLELLAEGKSHWHASILSAQHFFKSILSATMSISITFFPFLLFMTGSTHDFLLSFPWSMAIILFISMFVAQLIVPILQFFFIKKPIKSKLNGRKSFSILDWIQTKYNKLITVCFRHPYITLGCGFASVVISIFLFKIVPTQLMPAAERNQFAVEIYAPTGTALKQTSQIADSLEHILRKDSRVVSVTSFKGSYSPRFHNSYAPQFGGKNFAQFIVNTTDNNATEELVTECQKKYSTYFPDAYVRIKQLAYGDETNPVEIRLTGDNLDLLGSMTDSVMRRMRNMPELLLVRSDFNEPMPATKIQLNDDKASRVGITNSDVEQSMMIRYGDGLDVSTAWDGDYDVNVVLKSNHSDHATINNVIDEDIPAHMGMTSVPLRQIADIVPAWQHGQIAHRNGLRTVTIIAEVSYDYNIMDVSNKVISRLSDLKIPNGVKMSYGGKYEGDHEKGPSIAASLITSILIIFFILLWHTKRIGESILILVCLSLCLLGTVLGILITGVNFGMTCVLGIVSLMGILVRNGIILYDYADEVRENENLTIKEAIFESAKRRMRPIFLTSAAASMGVVPMILSHSSLWMPMGAVICYGSLITMLFILTVMPVAYWLVMSRAPSYRAKQELLEQQ
nr:efflux RND transporter permease subunit [Prevotella sp.]